MKKIILAFGVLTLITACQEQQKIAFVDRGEVINQYQEKIDVEDKYKPKNEAYIKRRDSLVQAFQNDYQQAAMKAQRMSRVQQQQLAQQLQQQEGMLSQQLQNEKENLEKEYLKEMDSTIARVKRFVSNYGKDNGYTYILGTAEGANSVMYGKADLDITEAVVKALNDSYKSVNAKETNSKKE